ncbi:MAG TPA: Gfo/Idh/MocA family oxidoreductase [Vicinamibacterales bacterium]
MRTFRFALVGCGSIARKHAHAVHHYLENAEIGAFVDVDISRAQEMGAKYGAPAFASAADMMRQVGDTIDVISVLTPSGLHCTNVLELARYGRPLVVEKPLALRLEDADRMIEACDRHGVRVFVVHQNRYNPPIVAAREALEQGRFGKLVLGTIRLRWKRDQAYYDSAAWRGTWTHDGGVFMNQAAHHIDMLTWFMGNVESVRSMAATRLVNIEAEDTGVAIMRFESGALGVLEATTAARPKDLEGSISILGEKGSVVIGGFFMNQLVTWEFEDRQPIDEVVFEKYGRNPPEFAANLGEYLKGVLASLSTNGAALVDGLSGRRSLELITALYESIETGTDVQLRFRPKRCRLGLAS